MNRDPSEILACRREIAGRAGLVSAVRGQPYLRRNRQNI